MSDFATSPIAIGIELFLAVLGLVLLWHFYLSPKARANPVPAALPIWIIRTSEFFLFLCCVCAGAIGTTVIISLAAKLFIKNQDMFMVVAGASFHPGLILGALIFHHYIEKRPVTLPLPGRTTKPFTAGAITFLIALPLIMLTSIVWQAGMRVFHLPIEQQELVDRILSSKDPVMIGIILIFAVGIGPIAEELVFRFGLFRFARGRLPTWLAYVLPSLAFAALHQNMASFGALTVLAIVLSVAYERTGNITVPIIAHALFNLNSIVMLIAGVKN